MHCKPTQCLAIGYDQVNVSHIPFIIAPLQSRQLHPLRTATPVDTVQYSSIGPGAVGQLLIQLGRHSNRANRRIEDGDHHQTVKIDVSQVLSSSPGPSTDGIIHGIKYMAGEFKYEEICIVERGSQL